MNYREFSRFVGMENKMLNLEAISEMSYGLGRLVDEFRVKFENFHEFKCPEFDDFNDVDNFYSRLNDLRESNHLLQY